MSHELKTMNTTVRLVAGNLLLSVDKWLVLHGMLGMASGTRFLLTMPRELFVAPGYALHQMLRTKLKKLDACSPVKNVSSLEVNMILMIQPQGYLPSKLLTVPLLLMMMTMLSDCAQQSIGDVPKKIRS